MFSATRYLAIFVLLGIGLGVGASAAEPLSLFAIQVRVGPKWDPAKAANEQALFHEHSANLKRLRDAGHLIMGARYSDIGLVIVAADSEASARAMMEADPSIAAGTFKYEVHPFNVFYSGTLQSPSLPTTSK